jgi:flagellar biosynthesis/type III secretory pathway protein FliH
MLDRNSANSFEIVFRATPRLGEIVRARLDLPLPTVPSPPPLASPASPTAQQEREERQVIEQVLAQLRKVTEQFAARHDAAIEEMRQAAIELAIAIAGRLVFDKLQAGEFPIEEMVRQALSRLPPAPVVAVYLHPDDLALLQRLADKPLLPARETQLRIEADTSLRRGSCRAEAGQIHVLADLSDQLAGLHQHLLWSANHVESETGLAAP